MINYDVGRLECAFRDGVSEALFDQLSELNRIPGYSVDHGTDKFSKDGFDKSVVFIRYNKAKRAEEAAEIIKEALSGLGYRFLLWKRLVNRACIQSTVLAEIFDR